MKKSFLAFLLLTLVPLAAHADVDPSNSGHPIIPGQHFIPNPAQQEEEKKQDLLNQQFKDAKCEPFMIDETSGGMTISVKKNEIFKIAFKLPSDTNDGRDTHMILAPTLRDFENPIQGWEDIPSLTDADGNDRDWAAFYGMKGLLYETSHAPELQDGVVEHSTYIANKTGAYPLTFKIVPATWMTNPYPQYRGDTKNSVTVTITIQVD